jgi:hypothetical protein
MYSYNHIFIPLKKASTIRKDVELLKELGGFYIKEFHIILVANGQKKEKLWS